ncbi:S41 family peptidase [Caldisericum exile]|uniref:Peptidase S41 family protein n=1 Tax=Caldisericum exile (strain DSM 21853 / NBRC 104410 / AZM16c01) TaxID=511051 RepID=A0A7U6GER4_CALEA|nr:S41 family peptidase [Caldisericum exile]BAL81038.1 peptidase S41 family protein [Caldisericum exile AZM16c01]
MKRNTILTVILLLIVSFVAGYFVGFRYPIGVSKTSSHLLLTRTADYLLSNFYKPITEEELIKGMVNSLNDPYTVFMNPEETKALQEEVKGEYAGIGVVINKNKELNYPEIVTVFKDSPAEKSGLIKGDIIVEVNGKSTYGLTLDEVASMVKGKVGTQVTLKIKRNSTELTFNIIRATINIPLTEIKYLDNGRIGYLSIFMFSEGAGKDVEKALNEFKEKNVRGIILDLRGNPGGLLSECENVASQFIPSGVLLYTKDRSGKLTPINISGKKLSIPMVVLVDGGTASASEILTGALKYYKVAKIIGEKTFGKGVIQQIFPLPQSYSLKITVEEYLLPDKSSINGIGIKPDIEVQDDPKTTQDEQLDKALELLKP